MKSLRLKHKYIQEISRGQRSAVLLVGDDQGIKVSEQVELVNDDSQEAVGALTIQEVISRRLEGFTNQQDLLVNVKNEQQFDPQAVATRLNFSFQPYHKKHQVANSDVNKYADLTEVVLHADGGSRGNPGPSASGWVITDPSGVVLKQGGQYLGITTNNQAEYQALKLGLEDARHLGARKVNAFMDSLLVVNQMKGIFKVRNRDLWPIHAAIKELAQSFQSVHYTQIPRALNKEADAMVNETLDSVRDNP